MSDIINTITDMKAFRSRTPAQISGIEYAEEKLGLKFSSDYKECLQHFGQFSIYGHEFTGITDASRLDVVKITIEEKQQNSFIPNDLYVVEQTHFDDVVIWQNEQGDIFQSPMLFAPVKIADSLLSYIKMDGME